MGEDIDTSVTTLRNRSPKHLTWSQLSTNSIKEESGSDDDDDDDVEDDEMTPEEKECMYNAVKIGDVDRFEDLLEKSNSDINMIRFNENLLMTAIRFDQEEMAEFLLDNGADHNYALLLIGNPETGVHSTEQYSYTCRQMAYDHQLFDIVEIIDIKNNRLFPGVKPRHRIPRYRREKPPTPTPDISDLPAQESDSSLKASGVHTVEKVKRKTKKLLKRVSVDLISLLDESEDSDDGNQQPEKRRFGSGRRSENRGSFLAGVNPSKSKIRSASNRSTKSIDRDSGVFSAEQERSTSQRSIPESLNMSPKPPTTKREPKAKSKTKISKSQIPLTPSIYSKQNDKRVKGKITEELETSENQSKKSFNPNHYKIFDNIARASRPTTCFQYVTDHSRCHGWVLEPNPRFVKKVKIHGSYGDESCRWYGDTMHVQSAGSQYRRKIDITKSAYTSPCQQLETEFRNGISRSYVNYRPLSRRKIQPNFRKSYTTLDFVFDL